MDILGGLLTTEKHVISYLFRQGLTGMTLKPNKGNLDASGLHTFGQNHTSWFSLIFQLLIVYPLKR